MTGGVLADRASHIARSPPLIGGVFWLRQLHRCHCRQRADPLPLQPGNGDDPSGLHDVRGRGLPHDDPAMQTGLEHTSV